MLPGNFRLVDTYNGFHLQLQNGLSSKVNVRLLRLCFQILQLLQYVGEVILQIFLKTNYIFCVHTKKTICLVHWSRENSIAWKDLQMQKGLRYSPNQKFRTSIYIPAPHVAKQQSQCKVQSSKHYLLRINKIAMLITHCIYSISKIPLLLRVAVIKKKKSAQFTKKHITEKKNWGYCIRRSHMLSYG